MNIQKSFKKINIRLLKKNEKKIFSKIFRIRNQKNVRKNMYNNKTIKLQDHINWMNRQLIDKRKKFYLINILGDLAGLIILSDIDISHKRADWAYYLSEKYQRGYGALIEFKFLDMFFKNKKFHKLNCEVLSFNKSVIKLHQRYGFKIEGFRRDHVFRNSIYMDAVMLGITNYEWRINRMKIKNILKI